MAGKHSPCLLWQYDSRSKNRLDDFRRRGVVSDAGFVFKDIGPFIRYDWTVECEGVLQLEATDDLKPLGSNRVVRRFYSYHATIIGGPNVIRYCSPDEEEQSVLSTPALTPVEDHHSHHHVHHFHPFSDKEEGVEVINKQESPTLLDFIEETIGWYEENRNHTQP